MNDNNYTLILTSQKLTQRCTEGEKVLPSISEITKAVVNLLESLMLPYSPEKLERNLNINYSILEQTENDNKDSSESEKASRIIYVTIRLIIQFSKQLKGNIVSREQTLNELYFTKSEQPSVKLQHYTNITIQSYIYKLFIYKKVL